MEGQKMKGTVRWFSNQRGYGFIAPEDGSRDIFAHFSNIQMKGYKTLKEGMVVEYELGHIEGKGPNALNIMILSIPEEVKVELRVEEPEQEEQDV